MHLNVFWDSPKISKATAFTFLHESMNTQAFYDHVNNVPTELQIVLPTGYKYL